MLLIPKNQMQKALVTMIGEHQSEAISNRITYTHYIHSFC